MNSVQFLDNFLNELENVEKIVHREENKVTIEIVMPNKENVFIDLLDEIIVRQGEYKEIFDSFNYGDTYEQNYQEAIYKVKELINKEG